MNAITTSPEIAEIAKAIAGAQAEMENVAKDRENPHFRARYATLAGVLDEVRPKLAKQGIAVIQMPVNGEGSNVGIVTRLLHSSGQWIESALYVAPTKFDAQGVGSVLTYLRRYSLMAIAGVGQEDDDGNAAVGRPDLRPRPQANGNGKVNGASLPPNPEEPPEIGEDRKRIRALIDRLAERIKTAPDEHRLEVMWMDALGVTKEGSPDPTASADLCTIEAAGPAGITAANALRAKYNAKIGELRSAK